MNIKRKVNLIRAILYIHEIVRCKSINRAAEENNIKASNLSLMIKTLENNLGIKLFIRSPSGCMPTNSGFKFARYGALLKELIQEIETHHEERYIRKRFLNIYISPNMKLDDCHEFEEENSSIKLNFVDDENLADIQIKNIPPANKNIRYTELCIGKGLQQKIWICCNEETVKAMKFFDFIVAKLLLLYGQ